MSTDILKMYTRTYNDTTAFNYTSIDVDIGVARRDSLIVVIPVTAIYVLIFFAGIIGNISTCFVIALNKSMHTATNYYLFSLAISDLLLLVSGLPQEIYSIWSKYPYVFGEIFCVLRGLAAETSTNATVLVITCFTVERYLAICHPFLSHTMSNLSRAVKLILFMWVVSLAFAMPQALQFGLTTRGILLCMQKRVIFEHSFEISTFLFFIAPMCLISALYALIALRLKRSGLVGARGASMIRHRSVKVNGSRTNQSTKRVIKMLVAVVVAFFVCWAPFHVQRLVAIYGSHEDMRPASPAMLRVYLVTTYLSGVLYYLSTTINPLLYHIMSNKFREAFKETVARRCAAARGRLSTCLLLHAPRAHRAEHAGSSRRGDRHSGSRKVSSADTQQTRLGSHKQSPLRHPVPDPSPGSTASRVSNPSGFTCIFSNFCSAFGYSRRDHSKLDYNSALGARGSTINELSNISNSSLKELEHCDIEDELRVYLSDNGRIEIQVK